MIILDDKLHQRFLKLIHFKSTKYSTPDTVYLFTLYLSMLVVGVSCITNQILELPMQVKILAFASLGVILYLYYLARFRHHFTLSKQLFFALVIVAMNLLWFYTEGSAGATFFILQALLPLIALYSSNKQTIYMVAIIVLNILLLQIIEIFFPHFIQSYPSPLHRSIDVLSISFFFLVFEVPALFYVNQLMHESKVKAEQANDAKTSYITNLSHEIRTPMNAILGFSELLADPDLERPEHDRYLSIVNQNGRQLLNLLNNIINLSQLEAKLTTVTLSEVHPIEIIKQVNDTLLPYFQSHDNIRLILSPPLVNNTILRSDPNLLYQIIMNLTFNAVKFTPKGYVEIGYTVQDDAITFFVKDSGIGIPKDIQPTIFERYQQVKSASGLSPVQGSGLGLAICKGLTQLLKGSIWFDSTPNKGTQFYVKLPVKSEL